MESVLNFLNTNSGLPSSFKFLVILSIIIIELFLRLKKTEKPQSIIYFIIFILIALLGALTIIAQKADKVLPQKTKE